jgi:hypothetical protein
MYRSLRSFIADARHNWLLAVPAGLYAINNYLKFAMQLYFRPTTTKMLGNLKIFTIAILMRTVLHRHFNILQYEALFLLVAGEEQMGSAGQSSLQRGCACAAVTAPGAWGRQLYGHSAVHVTLGSFRTGRNGSSVGRWEAEKVHA